MAADDSPERGEMGDGDVRDTELKTISTTIDRSALPHNWSNELEWTVTGCELSDGTDVPVDGTHGYEVRLITKKDWSSAELTGTITIPTDVYDHVIPEVERSGDPPTRLNVVIRCSDAVLRTAYEVTPSAGPGEYDFRLELAEDRLYGTAELSPVLTRRKPFPGDTDTYADRLGHRVAWAPNTDLARVIVNETDDLYGLFAPKRRRFSEDDNFPPEDHLVHVVLEGEDAPQLFVNADHEEVVQLLDIRGNRSHQAKLKQVAYDLIEAEVWPQLIATTARDLDETGEPRADWQWDVLRQVAEPIYGPEVDVREAGIRLREDVTSPDDVASLQADIEDFVQSKIDSPSDLQAVFEALRE